ncbi:universal stress protein UspA [Natronococcus pandeyae]|uniref:Universal stress protein UspA n=1 Tax=Natronococcus pandeyae TaxID=2055836 RepID=A0A8J8Q204_9EURY|nr:universal stress protein [Natronococcus pandeyae]TYL37482.1 universal stress protein UspA [Natronococcus pandeyae]
MQFLVGTDSVHTTAAICDYLERRATPEDDVSVIAAFPADDRVVRRDGQEALNVAPVRLATVGSVETDLREGEPAPVLLEAAAEVDADEIVVGSRGGTSGSDVGVGSTTRDLLEAASWPVVVVPIPELD